MLVISPAWAIVACPATTIPSCGAACTAANRQPPAAMSAEYGAAIKPAASSAAAHSLLCMPISSTIALHTPAVDRVIPARVARYAPSTYFLIRAFFSTAHCPARHTLRVTDRQKHLIHSGKTLNQLRRIFLDCFIYPPSTCLGQFITKKHQKSSRLFYG